MTAYVRAAYDDDTANDFRQMYEAILTAAVDAATDEINANEALELLAWLTDYCAKQTAEIKGFAEGVKSDG